MLFYIDESCLPNHINDRRNRELFDADGNEIHLEQQHELEN